jgi:peptide-methionine (S)-S-oxide reductase
MNKTAELATFGAGCFWCSEMSFTGVNGVLSTRVGFMGGSKEDPTYDEVCGGGTGHIEVVQMTYDPSIISYQALVDVFWNSHNPVLVKEGCGESGEQYRSAIFFHSEEQKSVALASKRRVQASGRFRGAISTLILPACRFWEADQHHQKYLARSAQAACGNGRSSLN